MAYSYLSCSSSFSTQNYHLPLFLFHYPFCTQHYLWWLLFHSHPFGTQHYLWWQLLLFHFHPFQPQHYLWWPHDRQSRCPKANAPQVVAGEMRYLIQFLQIILQICPTENTKVLINLKKISLSGFQIVHICWNSFCVHSQMFFIFSMFKICISYQFYVLGFQWLSERDCAYLLKSFCVHCQLFYISNVNPCQC